MADAVHGLGDTAADVVRDQTAIRVQVEGCMVQLAL